MTDLVARINEYLSVGGLFNPELMDHEKVRDLLIACRDRLNTAKGANAGVGHPALRQVGASQLHDTESESRHPAGGPADEPTPQSSNEQSIFACFDAVAEHYGLTREQLAGLLAPTQRACCHDAPEGFHHPTCLNIGSPATRPDEPARSPATDSHENAEVRADQRQCRHLKVTGEVTPDGKVIRETCDDCEAVLPPFTPAEDA